MLLSDHLNVSNWLLPVQQAAIKQYLCSWFDTSSDSPENSDNDPPAASGAHPCSYCVIATTNRPADVDPRLRRGGRLEREIEVSGCKADRVKLLTTLLAALSSRLGGQLGDATQGGAIECVASNIADRTGKRRKWGKSNDATKVIGSQFRNYDDLYLRGCAKQSVEATDHSLSDSFLSSLVSSSVRHIYHPFKYFDRWVRSGWYDSSAIRGAAADG